jgi:membrane associated rhomboid family serine protease/Zn-finger nucleic acid-binding protein
VSGFPGFFGCSRCGGEALNLHVLRQNAANAAVNRIWQLSGTEPKTSPLPCPSCGRASSTVLVGDEIDVCRACQMIWFDAAELGRLDGFQRPQKPCAQTLAMRQKLAEALVKANAEGRTDWTPDNNLQRVLLVLGMPIELNDRVQARTPWATWLLAGLIVLVSVAAFPRLGVTAKQLGFLAGDPFRSGGLTWISSFFLHGGLMHLIGNVYFLLLFGDDVEDILGPARYIALVLAATLLGHFAHCLFTRNLSIPAIGASGGISGLIAFYALEFPNSKIGLLSQYRGTFRMRVSTAAAIWVFLQILGATLSLGRVAHVAHLGGALAGYLAYHLASRAAGPSAGPKRVWT